MVFINPLQHACGVFRSAAREALAEMSANVRVGRGSRVKVVFNGLRELPLSAEPVSFKRWASEWMNTP